MEEVSALCVIWSLFQANCLEFKQTAKDLPAVSCICLHSYTAIMRYMAIFPGSWGPVQAKHV